MAIGVTTNKLAYNANITLAFDYNGIREPIESEKIAYIMIEHDYDNQVLPIIYISLAVNNSLYSKITKYKDNAKFYLKIQKTNKNSSISISKQTIEGTFNYIPSNTNPNYKQDLTPDTSVDATYMRMMIGLVSIELSNELRRSFNGVYNNIDQKTLIGMALEGTKCIVENIQYNKTFSSIVIPPISSRYKLIDFVFNKSNFYDTKFRYFMDFEKSYLVSKCGNAINANDGQLETVIVDIKAVTSEEAYYDGMEIKNNSYYIYVNPANTSITLNQGVEKVANQIVAVEDGETVQTLDLNINNSVDSETKQTFIRTFNGAALYKNELEMDTITLEFTKQHIDGANITPNKTILVNNYGEYSKYNGKYYLVYKKEFYKCVAGEFVLSCIIGLKKVGNIQKSKVETETPISPYSNNNGTRISSASKKSTNKVTPATVK